ncbi:MAG: hypothetical protein HY716_13270 [Planctomycetes bacterium]|nr:hypothetical protein [Planctomycetota bacterium]
MRSYPTLVPAFLLMAAAFGCGKSEPPAPAPEKPQTPTAAAPAAKPRPSAPDGAKGTARIGGTVRFSGTPPRPGPIDMSAVAYCAQHHKETVFGEDIVLGKGEGGRFPLANVFVYVKEGVGKYEAPRDEVLLDQIGCTYKPHVLGLMANQPLRIRNSDDTIHNIHPTPKLNPEFNIGQASRGMENIKTFAIPEIGINTRCNVHPWMGAWIHVVGHPFHSVSGLDGAFELKDLPAGDFLVAAVHERLGTQVAEVKLSEGESRTIEFTFEKR